MNMEEIPTTFDKKEISLYRKNIAIAILLRGGMYRTNEIFLLISDKISFYNFTKQPRIFIKTFQTTWNFNCYWSLRYLYPDPHQLMSFKSTLFLSIINN